MYALRRHSIWAPGSWIEKRIMNRHFANYRIEKLAFGSLLGMPSCHKCLYLESFRFTSRCSVWNMNRKVHLESTNCGCFPHQLTSCTVLFWICNRTFNSIRIIYLVCLLNLVHTTWKCLQTQLFLFHCITSNVYNLVWKILKSSPQPVDDFLAEPSLSCCLFIRFT
jgi:hypothetical protein